MSRPMLPAGFGPGWLNAKGSRRDPGTTRCSRCRRSGTQRETLEPDVLRVEGEFVGVGPGAGGLDAPSPPRSTAPVRRPPPRPDGPLVARRDLGGSPRPTISARPGRVRRFLATYGWRAYAIPPLAVATVVTLGQMAFAPVVTVDSASTPVSAPARTAAVTAPAPVTAPPPALEGDAGPTGTPVATGAVSFVQKGTGTVSVVDGTSPVYGTGPLKRFVVETENGIKVDGAAFAEAVQSTLSDPRSWGHGGAMSFQRVGVAAAASGAYDFKVALISPDSMEIFCPGVGTEGYTSCRYADRAVINLARWETAVPDYKGDIATYRLYVVNHEVGHALGHHHEFCAGPGQVAPVMQQQTLGLKGCVKNAWPYP